MKIFLISALALAGLPLLAQTSTTTTSTTTSATTPPAAPTAQSMRDQVMSVLSPTEQAQLAAAHQKALTDNPKLQTEQMELMQKGMALETGTATDADKAAFRTQAQAYSAKVRLAIVKADPSVEPLLQKVEAAAAKMQAQYQNSH